MVLPGQISADANSRAQRRAVVKHTSRIGTFFRILFLPVKLLPPVLICLIAYIPWLCLPFTRPRINGGARWKYDPNTQHSARDILNVSGTGPSKSWLETAWDLYGIGREVFTMIKRQALQLVGVFSGLTILIMQIMMMSTDLSSETVGHPSYSIGVEGRRVCVLMIQVTSYVTAVTTGDKSAGQSLTTDIYCAYTIGTGIANWGGGTENLGEPA